MKIIPNKNKRNFELIMISAMYENGGNVTHRLLDGHPELYVYPFESQLGTRFVSDYLSSLFPFKYRWPEFPLSNRIQEDYDLFYDEELKTRLRRPEASKFKHTDLLLDESERRKTFTALAGKKSRTRANLVAAFFQATFSSWKNCHRSGKERIYVGYSPIIAVDAEKILADFPRATIVHVTRNPYSAYADTKRRPFPLSLHQYAWTWNLIQNMALSFARRFPRNFHILRYEDLLRYPRPTLSKLCRWLGISFSNSLLYPSWNGAKLDQVFPWGTIRTPTTQANDKTMRELSKSEKGTIRLITDDVIRRLEYTI